MIKKITTVLSLILVACLICVSASYFFSADSVTSNDAVESDFDSESDAASTPKESEHEQIAKEAANKKDVDKVDKKHDSKKLTIGILNALGDAIEQAQKNSKETPKQEEAIAPDGPFLGVTKIKRPRRDPNVPEEEVQLERLKKKREIEQARLGTTSKPTFEEQMLLDGEKEIERKKQERLKAAEQSGNNSNR